jgi:AraC family cel operon transcriptional repressor
MACEKLTVINAIDPEIQAHYRLITSVKNTMGEHCHEFFELFLIVKGSIIHCINGQKQLLDENTLVFVRDRDVHYYEQAGEEDCQFINLSFYRETIDSIFDFLGEGFPKDNLLNPPMPPSIVLTKPEKEYMQYRLQCLNRILNADKGSVRAQLRALLTELFSRYIMKQEAGQLTDRPKWFSELLSEMEIKENFVEGMPAVLRLSGRTHSYLCRLFRKHLETTPTDYVASLRMSYAENLLLHTDMSIVDICYETGFENMSYFYEVFKKYFSVTPHRFRKNTRRTACSKL